MNYLKITGKIPSAGEIIFVIKVVLPYYVPQNVKVLKVVDNMNFTGSCDVSHLDKISDDKNVIFISIN